MPKDDQPEAQQQPVPESPEPEVEPTKAEQPTSPALEFPAVPFPFGLMGGAPAKPLIEGGILSIPECHNATLSAYQVIAQLAHSDAPSSVIDRLTEMKIGHRFCKAENDHAVCCKCGDRHHGGQLRMVDGADVPDILKGWQE